MSAMSTSATTLERMEDWLESLHSFAKNHSTLQEALDYHLSAQVPLSESIFRAGSDSYFQLFNFARQRLQEGAVQLSALDKHLLEHTDIGTFGLYEDTYVPLDYPMIAEAEYQGKEVELNKPKRGGSKKFYVYVKDPDTGNVKKVEFGDTSGLSVKISDPEARKSFAARHQCDKAKDKTTAKYWSCNLPRYAKSLGLAGGGNYYW